jgi:hypothetical protein
VGGVELGSTVLDVEKSMSRGKGIKKNGSI